MADFTETAPSDVAAAAAETHSRLGDEEETVQTVHCSTCTSLPFISATFAQYRYQIRSPTYRRIQIIPILGANISRLTNHRIDIER